MPWGSVPGRSSFLFPSIKERRKSDVRPCNAVHYQPGNCRCYHHGFKSFQVLQTSQGKIMQFYCFRCRIGFSASPLCPRCGTFTKGRPSRKESKAILEAFHSDSSTVTESLNNKLTDSRPESSDSCIRELIDWIWNQGAYSPK